MSSYLFQLNHEKPIKHFKPIFENLKKTNNLCAVLELFKLCGILNNLGLLFSWKIVYFWPPLWSALKRKCCPSVWLSFMFASRNVGRPNSSSLQHKHKHTHSQSSLFSLQCVFFHGLFLSYSASPDCVCQWHCFVVGPLQAQLCLTRVLLLSIYRRGLSLCLSICATYCICTFFPICESLYPFPSDYPFPFQPLSFLYFDIWEWRTLPVNCSVLSGQTTCEWVNTSPSLYCLQLTLCNTTDLPHPALKSLFSSGIWGVNIF